MAKGQGYRFGTSFTSKAIMIGINFAMTAYSVLMEGFTLTFSQLSYWVIVILTLHLCVSLKCSLDPEINKKFNWLAIHHVSFEILSPMNLLVIIVYWSILRANVVNNECDTLVAYIHTTLVHSLPLLFNILTFLKTDIVVKATHAVFIVPIAIVYGFLNYQAFKRLGHPVYDFLPWTDIWTPITIAGLATGCMLA